MEDIFIFLISLFFVLAAVLSWLRLSGLVGFFDRAVSGFLLAIANVVLSTVILSELQFITPMGYLAIQAGIAVLSVFFALRYGAKLAPDEACKREFLSQGLGSAEKIIITALVFAVGAVSLLNLFLALYVPPGGSDALSYHLSRVGHWRQNATLRHYFTHDIRQLWTAPNVDVLILWVSTLLETDRLAAVFQWISGLVAALVIFGVSLSSGSSRPASIFSALVFLSLPMVVMESSSIQGELVTTALLVSAFYFLDSGMKEKRYSLLVVSACGFGLAVGAKEEALLFATPAFIAASIAFAIAYRAGLKLYVRWFIVSIGLVVLLGSYNYLQYNEDYGSALMPKYDAGFVRGDKTLSGTARHFFQMAYKSAAFAGLPEPAVSFLENKKAAFAGNRLPFLSTDPAKGYALGRFSFDRIGAHHEDFGWSGFLGFFVLFPAAIWLSARSIVKRRFDARLVYFIMPIFFFLLMSYMRAFANDEGRLLLIPLAFVAPATALLWDSSLRRARTLAIAAVSIIAAYGAIDAVLNNVMKPVIGHGSEKTVFDREFRYAKASYGPLPKGVPMIEFVDVLVQPRARIGHVIKPFAPDYPFFAKGFANEVRAINPYSIVLYGKQGMMDVHYLTYFVEEIAEDEADSTFDLVLPVFSPPGGLPTNRWRYRISARRGWDKEVDEWLDEKIVQDDDFTLWDAVTAWSLHPIESIERSRLATVVELLGAGANLSTPLRIAMDRASESELNEAVVIAGKKTTLNGAGHVPKLSYDKRVFSVLANIGDNVSGGFFGSVSGGDSEIVKVYVEGKAIARDVKVNEDKVFWSPVESDKFVKPGGSWRLMRAEVLKPEGEGKGARFGSDIDFVDVTRLPALFESPDKRALYVFDRHGEESSMLVGRVRGAGGGTLKLEDYNGAHLASVAVSKADTFIVRLPRAKAGSNALYRISSNAPQKALLYGAVYGPSEAIMGKDGLAFISNPGKNIALSGFHPLEGSGIGTYRWTDGDAEALFTLPTGFGDKLELEITCLKKGPVGAGVVSFNGRELRGMDCGGFGATAHRFAIPANMLSPSGVEVIRIASKTFSPAEMGNVKDARRLGLAVMEIKVRPAR